MESDRYFQTYSTGQSAQERKLSHVPECYEVPPSQQPTLNSPQAHVPVVDLAGFRISPIHRSAVIQSIRKACVHFGIFQVVNHGIDQTVLNKALGAVDGFFRLPANEILKFMSNDVHKPVRYGTSLKDGVDKIQFWRVFLKLYANPLENRVQSWPENPPTYRCRLGRTHCNTRRSNYSLGESYQIRFVELETNICWRIHQHIILYGSQASCYYIVCDVVELLQRERPSCYWTNPS